MIQKQWAIKQIPCQGGCNLILFVLHKNPKELVQDHRKKIHDYMDLLNSKQILIKEIYKEIY